MTADTSQLAKRIESELHRAEERIAQQRESVQEESRAMDERLKTFERTAVNLAATELKPRMLEMVSRFPAARLDGPDGALGPNCTAVFPHTVRFPASVTLRMGFSYDEMVHELIVRYDLEILPIFMKFDPHDQVAFDLNSVDPTTVTKWIDDHIVRFVETYLQLEFVDQYQQTNFVTDPVSGLRFNSAAAAATTDYQGHTLYFASEEHLRQFEADPDRYFSK